jgi:hypothetical protein
MKELEGQESERKGRAPSSRKPAIFEKAPVRAHTSVVARRSKLDISSFTYSVLFPRVALGKITALNGAGMQ